MKKLLMFTLLLFGTVTLAAASALDPHPHYYVAPDVGYMSVDFSSDYTVVMIKHPKSGKYNSWYIYNAVLDEEGNFQLTGIGEVKDDTRHDTFLTSQVPGPITILNPDSDSPRMVGWLNSSLRPAPSGSFNYEKWQMAHSLADYSRRPEAYNPDSVAGLSKNAYALVNSYVEMVQRERYEQYIAEKTRNNELKTVNSRWLGALLLPLFIACFVLGLITRGGRISTNFNKKIRAIAVVEVVGLIFATLSLNFIPAYGLVVTLAVLAILATQIYNIFFGLFAHGHITETLNAKMPWVQTIIFGIAGMFVPIAVLGIVGMLLVPDAAVSTEYSPWAVVGGCAAILAVVALLGWWYRNALIAAAPQIKGNFVPIAIMTAFTIFGVVALFLVAIVYVLIKYVGAAFVKESQSPQYQKYSKCYICIHHNKTSCPGGNGIDCPYYEHI